MDFDATNAVNDDDGAVEGDAPVTPTQTSLAFYEP